MVETQSTTPFLLATRTTSLAVAAAFTTTMTNAATQNRTKDQGVQVGVPWLYDYAMDDYDPVEQMDVPETPGSEWNHPRYPSAQRRRYITGEVIRVVPLGQIHFALDGANSRARG